MTRIAVFLGALTLFAVAAANAAQQRAQAPVMVPLMAGDDPRPVMFAKIAPGLPANTPIGTRGIGLLCATRESITTSNARALDNRAYGPIFRAEFEAARYKVLGGDNQLFNDRESKSDLLVGAIITGAKIQACYLGQTVFTNADEARASASVEIEWQIYSQLDRKVLFRATSSGEGRVSSQPKGEEKALQAAFAQATRALLTNQSLHDFLNPASLPMSNDVANSTAPFFNLKPVPLASVRFQDHATDIRANVATVFSAGSGSGFFINDGYLVTNEHVVGQAKFVKVRLLTGREVVGEVVATNSRRDVALVKTENVGLPGLPIRMTEAGIGSQVFVIGSPLGVENEGSVMSGIISTYRVDNGQSVIQSDVAVQHGNSGGPMVDENGNVIGITDYGRTVNGAPASVNFFIPIGDGLNKLGVTISAK